MLLPMIVTLTLHIIRYYEVLCQHTGCVWLAQEKGFKSVSSTVMMTQCCPFNKIQYILPTYTLSDFKIRCDVTSGR